MCVSSAFIEHSLIHIYVVVDYYMHRGQSSEGVEEQHYKNALYYYSQSCHMQHTYIRSLANKKSIFLYVFYQQYSYPMNMKTYSQKCNVCNNDKKIKQILLDLTLLIPKILYIAFVEQFYYQLVKAFIIKLGFKLNEYCLFVLF